MEVMLATAILLACTVVLVELSNSGRRNSMAALDQATAQTISQSTMSEILLGVRGGKLKAATPLEEYPGWTLEIVSEPLESAGLAAVTVTATQENQLGKIQSYSLTRWISTADSLPGIDGPGSSEERMPDANDGDDQTGTLGIGSGRGGS